MDGHLQFLEYVNGGPLTFNVEAQVEVEERERSCSAFDPYEVGAVADVSTFVDAQWRRDTRPKRMRPRSAD